MLPEVSAAASWAAVVAAMAAAVYPLVSAYFKRPRLSVTITSGTVRAPGVSWASGSIDRPQVHTVGGGRRPVVQVEVVTGRQPVTLRQWGVQARSGRRTREIEGTVLSGGPAPQLRLGANDAASWRVRVGDLRLSAEERNDR